MSGSKPSAYSALAAVIVGSFLFSLIIFAYHSHAARAQATERVQPNILSNQTVHESELKAIRRQLSISPLEQKLWNLYVVGSVGLQARRALEQAQLTEAAVQSEWTKDVTRRTGLADILASLGWRDTASSQTLLVFSALNSDFEGAIDRIDSLLRRQKIEEQAFEALFNFEAYPEGRKAIAKRVADRVIWRERYFKTPVNLKNPARLANRVALVGQILGQGTTLRRSEIGPVINWLVASQDMGEAYRLWKALQSSKGRDDILYDSSFDVLANLDTIDDALTLPFEWKKMEGLGYEVEAIRFEKGSDVQIRWDGRGTPVFISQVFHNTRPTRLYAVIDVNDTESEDLDQITMDLRCDQTVVEFENFRKDIKRMGRYRTMTQDVVPCKFPKLQVMGRDQRVQRAVDVNMAALFLLPGPN